MGIYNHNFEMRRVHRSELRVWGLFRWQGRKAKNKALISELSKDGCRLQPGMLFCPNDYIYLELDTLAPFPARIVWSSDNGGEYGCRFAVPLAQEVVDHIVRSSSEDYTLTNIPERYCSRSGPLAELRI